MPVFERICASRRLAPALLGLLGVLLPARAHAQRPSPVALEWTAPAECPRLEEVQARIAKLAGPLKPNGTPLRAQATITRKEDGDLHLRLLIWAGNLVGERNIDGESCNALVGATTVALVLLLHSGAALSQNDLLGQPPASSNEATNGEHAAGDAASHSSTEPGAQAQPPKPATSPTQPHSSATTSETLSHRRWHLLAQLPLGVLGIGPLRQANFGVAFAGGVSFDRWRFLAKGTLWFPEHATTTLGFQKYGVDFVQQYGADIQRSTATLLVCHALSLSQFEIAPCASLSLEHASARGSGAHIDARTAGASWLAAGLGAQARVYAAPWLSFVLGVEGEIEAARPQFDLGGVGSFDRLLPAAVTGTVGSEWIF